MIGLTKQPDKIKNNLNYDIGLTVCYNYIIANNYLSSS
jgi:hypothetical protein